MNDAPSINSSAYSVYVCKCYNTYMKKKYSFKLPKQNPVAKQY